MIWLLAVSAVGLGAYYWTREKKSAFRAWCELMLRYEAASDRENFLKAGAGALSALPQHAKPRPNPPGMYQAALVRPEQFGTRGLVQLAMSLEAKGYYYEAASVLNMAMVTA